MNIRLSKELIAANVDMDSKEEVITMLCNRLYEHGHIKDTFLNAILEREKIYPTGLQLRECGVAIPHTDAHHVNDPSIAIAVLSQPVNFMMMGNPEEDVAARMVFVLAVKEPKQQLALLERLMELFQKDAIIKELKDSTHHEDIVTILTKELELKQ